MRKFDWDDYPEWKKALTDAELVDPYRGVPSMRQLADAAGMSTVTLSAIIRGDRQTLPSVEQLKAIAEQLKISADEVGQWAERSMQDHSDRPFPAGWTELDNDEKDAVEHFVNWLVSRGRRRNPPEPAEDTKKRGHQRGKRRQPPRRKDAD
ncbi:helix-turn-helix domain-containing protein [Prescottella agglutinans]|uniref:Transcriptional regulator with XRE-family HTH domain n=1 Tax=Prescottella agglutinans TaxID=1644129 RepID=A0ABT6MFT2_9NOCA|nr:helix-turn-helix transcriptional regulator [Prescottella agglutinans]MDH6283148.1 transcriptional regulator with XRE-family HTH domain [Prescottella agglutinans]